VEIKIVKRFKEFLSSFPWIFQALKSGYEWNFDKVKYTYTELYLNRLPYLENEINRWYRSGNFVITLIASSTKADQSTKENP